MASALKSKMTVDEFLSLAEAREGRWELHDGAPVMLSPERVAHVDAKGVTYRTLWNAVERGGLPCCVYTDGVAIRIDAQTVYEPDASVARGPRPSPDAIEIADPIILVEVLSPSTAAIDHGRKLSAYFSVPSVQHDLILDPERRVAIHRKRGQGDAIETRVLADGFVRLDPPGLDIPVADMFAPL